MPQLTIRSGLTGMGLGLILSLTNLYIGVMTGWTLGVGVTSEPAGSHEMAGLR
jgi:hypothetical protein